MARIFIFINLVLECILIFFDIGIFLIYFLILECMEIKKWGNGEMGRWGDDENLAISMCKNTCVFAHVFLHVFFLHVQKHMCLLHV